jgi:hypothetical protein
MSNENPSASTSTPLLRAILLGVLIVLAAVTGFAFYQRNAAKQLAAQNEQVTAALSQTHAQIDELNTKLNTVAASVSETAQPAKPAALPAKGAGQPAAKIRRDDPRWKKLQATPRGKTWPVLEPNCKARSRVPTTNWCFSRKKARKTTMSLTSARLSNSNAKVPLEFV